MSNFVVGNPNTQFGLVTSINIPTLAALADAGTATSDVINNSIVRYPEYLIQISLGGTAVATAWLDVRMVVSIDGGVTYQLFENGFVLPPLTLITTPQVYHARVLAPEYWRLVVKNNTGAVLTSGTAFYQGIRR